MLANYRILIFTAVVLSVVGGAAGIGTENCSAQVLRYQPRKPTVSPYLNLTRLNTGAVPNYYSLVRPIQRQRAFNQQERAFRSQQTASLQQLQNNVQQGLQLSAGTGKQSGFLQPSGRVTFGTSSTHYFQTNIGVGRR